MINLLLWKFDTRIYFMYNQGIFFLSVQLMVRSIHVAGGLYPAACTDGCMALTGDAFYICCH